MGLTVVGKAHATVIISSAGFNRFSPRVCDVNADMAKRLAEEPELARRQWPTPKNFVNLSSKSFENLPAVSQKNQERHQSN